MLNTTLGAAQILILCITTDGIWWKGSKVKLNVHHLLRSSCIVFCRLAMLASRAARPSLNAASSLVLNVDSDLTLQSDCTDSTSQWDSIESNSRLRTLSAFPSLSAAKRTCSAGSSWSRDIRYWVMCSVGGPAGCSLCCCCIVSWASDTESTTVAQSDESWPWKVLKQTEDRTEMGKTACCCCCCFSALGTWSKLQQEMKMCDPG